MIFFCGIHTHIKNQEKCNGKNMEPSKKNFASERTIEGKEVMGNDIFKRKEGIQSKIASETQGGNQDSPVGGTLNVNLLDI